MPANWCWVVTIESSSWVPFSAFFRSAKLFSLLTWVDCVTLRWGVSGETKTIDPPWMRMGIFDSRVSWLAPKLWERHFPGATTRRYRIRPDASKSRAIYPWQSQHSLYARWRGHAPSRSISSDELSSTCSKGSSARIPWVIFPQPFELERLLTPYSQGIRSRLWSSGRGSEYGDLWQGYRWKGRQRSRVLFSEILIL